MRDYLTTKAPWWLLALIHGGTFWIIALIGKALAPSWWPVSYLWGGLSGAIFGLIMATLTVGPRSRGAEKDTTDN